MIRRLATRLVFFRQGGGSGKPLVTLLLLSAGLVLAACGAGPGEGAACPAGGKADTPSGYCLPRYLSLKRGEVFGRKGPGKDYPTLFVYHAQGLPVQVVDETSDWRRICDPDGGLFWVSRALVDGRRTVMALGPQPVPLRAQPKAEAAALAYLRPRAVADLDKCAGAWCKVSAGGQAGWVAPAQVWGLADSLQCKLSATPAPARAPSAKVETGFATRGRSN
jgi:SH3-like domain-containing protein